MAEARAPRLIVTHAPERAFAPFTRSILGNLGYAILGSSEWRSSPIWAVCEPELHIVEEAGLADLLEQDPGSPTPVIVVTGRRGLQSRSPRVVGALRRPAGLHELYRLLQQTLEETPRSALRVPTHLSARCRCRGREWSATLLCLSESGGLLRSSEPLPLGSVLELAFDLPAAGRVETRADCAYQIPPDTGLVFQSTPPASRRAIVRFVEESLGAVRRP